MIVGSLLGIGCGILWYALFTMVFIQEKLRWLDRMIEELEILQRNYLIRNSDMDGENDDDDDDDEKKMK